MDEQIKQALANLLQSINSGADFVAGQMPEVLHQLLVYQAISNAVWMLVGLVGMLTILLPFAVWRWLGRKPDVDAEDRMAATGVFCVVPVVAGLTGTLTFVSSGVDLLQIWLAPKYYLVQHAASMIH